MVLTFENITEAMKAGRMDGTPEAEIRDGMEAVMRDAYILAGYDPFLLGDQLDDLAKDVASSFRHLSLQEVRLAAKAGVTGELGDRKKPSYAALMAWLDAYDKSAMVADVRKSLRTRREYRTLSQEEGLKQQALLSPRCLRRRWDDVRSLGRFGTGCIAHVSAQLYDWLGEEGMIHLTDEQKAVAARKGRDVASSMSVWDITPRLESGNDLRKSYTKHYALELWMQEQVRQGKPFQFPDKMIRIYQ